MLYCFCSTISMNIIMAVGMNIIIAPAALRHTCHVHVVCAAGLFAQPLHVHAAAWGGCFLEMKWWSLCIIIEHGYSREEGGGGRAFHVFWSKLYNYTKKKPIMFPPPPLKKILDPPLILSHPTHNVVKFPSLTRMGAIALKIVALHHVIMKTLDCISLALANCPDHCPSWSHNPVLGG